MPRYAVYYPYDQVLNTLLKRGEYEYQFMYRVNAESLEEVFRFCQNENSEFFEILPCFAADETRSMSVGDIIVDEDTDTHYFVKGVGFQEIPHTVLQFIDWGYHVPDIDETDKIQY